MQNVFVFCFQQVFKSFLFAPTPRSHPPRALQPSSAKPGLSVHVAGCFVDKDRKFRQANRADAFNKLPASKNTSNPCSLCIKTKQSNANTEIANSHHIATSDLFTFFGQKIKIFRISNVKNYSRFVRNKPATFLFSQKIQSNKKSKFNFFFSSLQN